MPNIKLDEPVIVDSSTNEPICWGAYQLPRLRLGDNNKLYYRFHGRRDCIECVGQEDKMFIFSSVDEGKTWQKEDSFLEFYKSAPLLPNGDRLQFGECQPLKNPTLPDKDERRKTRIMSNQLAYKFSEIKAIYGNKVNLNYPVYRIKKGETEPVAETCTIHWDNCPMCYHESVDLLVYPTIEPDELIIAPNGALIMPVHGPAFFEDGSVSPHSCMHFLISEDNGYNWNLQGTLYYREEYNTPTAHDVEGFSEISGTFSENGELVMFLRTGSLVPFNNDGVGLPIPNLYVARSKDLCKTFYGISPFNSYGMRPYIIKMNDTCHLLTYGRPGSVLQASFDKNLEKWEKPIKIIDVPQEDIYTKYFEYTCCNNFLCKYNENTAFLAYSDFTRKENGKQAKTLMVRKITVEY